ncbi:B3GALTL family protein [Megaselia abdita]
MNFQFSKMKPLLKVILLAILRLTTALNPDEITIFISCNQQGNGQEYSYNNNHNNQFKENLRESIYNQSILISKDNLINVYFLHEIFDQPGYWTFLNALPYIMFETNLVKPNTKWIILSEDLSSFDLHYLLNSLAKEDHNKPSYFGYPIYDNDATVVHHFAFFKNPKWFPYPLLASGVAFTIPLIERLAKRVVKVRPKTDFTIDASHELALFIYYNGNDNSSGTSTSSTEIDYPQNTSNNENNSSTGCDCKNSANKAKNRYHNDIGNFCKAKCEHEDGTAADHSTTLLTMSKASYFCSKNPQHLNDKCAVFPNAVNRNNYCKQADRAAIYFAIKTCQTFHNKRIPFIQSTWGQYAVFKRFFSDVKDSSIPTINTGVPNTDNGHCLKTLTILKLAYEEIQNLNLNQNSPNQIQWLFLADDDTLLSVSGVCEILGCYNHSDYIYLGERYGYRLHSKDGFNYITGGGGIVFSLPTVQQILKFCSCPSLSSPDDMILGACLNRLKINAIHSPRFHQVSFQCS